MQNEKPNVAALVERLPSSDRAGEESKFTGPHPDEAKRIILEVLKGGLDSVRELLGLVRDSTDSAYRNFKADYLLHCLAGYVSRSGNEELRRELARLIASRIGREEPSKRLRAYFIRELQAVGGQEVVRQLAEQLQDDDLCATAVQALVAIGGEAAARLRLALRESRGRNRMAIVQALGVLQDGESVPALIEAAGQRNRRVRMAAVWALANIGDSRAVNAVMKAGDTENVWERIQATKACLVLAEKLLAGGRKGEARKIYSHLRETRNNPAERYVTEAAAKALSEI
ncbi:MAG: HEAT repeat domain-containing protein [Phycisphaerales bacterium]|nr:MAG: HEAT repeat domain-containing protein [Phycisphaerales bacterium]